MDPVTVAVVGILILMVLGYLTWQFVFSIVIERLVARGMDKLGTKLGPHIKAAIEDSTGSHDLPQSTCQEPPDGLPR